jgi:hypothetical protein
MRNPVVSHRELGMGVRFLRETPGSRDAGDPRMPLLRELRDA